MPKSSRHKSYKRSRHSSKDYSDSEEDVVKMNEKSSKAENSTGLHRESASGEKRKISYQSREGKDGKDLSVHVNEDVVEDYVSSKRRKEKADADIGRDRWNGGGDEMGDDGERIVEKEIHKGESLKLVKEIRKSKENSSKGESLRTEPRSRSKRHESGFAGERKEEIIASVVVEKEESKSRGESKRKSERDSSSHKEGKESKDKDRRSEKEKSEGHASKSADTEVQLVNLGIGKKQGTQSVDLVGERQSKRSQENNDDLQNLELDKDNNKKLRKKREGSCERVIYYEESKESEVRRSSSKASHAKESKYRDDKNKDGGHADKYQEDSHRDDRRKDEKYWEETDKDNRYHEKYWEDGERDSRRKYDRHREVVDRDSRHKDEKYHDKGERNNRRKDEKYPEEVEREIRKDIKYHEDRDHENGDKDVKRGGESYYEDGDRDGRRKGSSFKDDSDRDYRHKEEKYREDTERDVRYKDSKQGDGYDREKRPRDSKYRNEYSSRDHSVDKSDPKCYRGDGYSAAHHVRKSSAYDESLTQDDRAGRYRDDQGRRRTSEKEDYSYVKSRRSKDQTYGAEKNIASSGKMDLGSNTVKSTSRNVDVELTSGHNRRQSSPTSDSHVPRDNDRGGQQDESKYRDYNYEERSRHSMNSSRDHAGPEKTPSRSFEKLGQKDDVAHVGDLSTERRLKPGVRSSPLPLVDKSPSSSVERRLFSARRNVDVDESTHRSGGSQAWKDYPARDSRTNREFDTDFHPSDDLLKQADGDTQSVSSPFIRNSRFPSSSKSMPPPLHSLLSPSEDDGKRKPIMRHRRMGEPNIGRMQGNNNAWRGYPTWHAPLANGVLPYPHAPPPIGFHSVMQPFHAPPMFGVRPSLELSHHPSPFHVPDANRYASSGRPMGWRSQLDDPCPPPPHGWDMSNPLFGDEPRVFGVRSEWDLARNISGGQVWESGNLPPHEKDNNLIRSGDEALGNESIQPPPNELSQAQMADGADDVLQSADSFEKRDDIVSAIISSGGSAGGGVARVLGKDVIPPCHVYLSKLDLSVGLADPELFGKCLSLIDVDKTMVPDVDHSKILLVEDAKMGLPGLSTVTLFASADDSVFEKCMSLYKRQKNNFWTEYGEEPKFPIKFVVNSDHKNVKDETENLCPTDPLEGMGDKTVALQHEIGQSAGDTVTTENPYEPDADVDLEKHDHDGKPSLEESVEISDTPSGHVEDVPMGFTGIKIEELELVDVKYDPLLHSDVLSQASVSVMPESTNLSRIHHSPESTH